MDIWHFLFLYKKEVSLIQLSTEKRNQSGHFKSLFSRGTAIFKVLRLCSICYFCWWMLDIDRRYVPDIAYLTRCIHSSITRDIEFQLLYTIPRKFTHSLGTIHVQYPGNEQRRLTKLIEKNDNYLLWPIVFMITSWWLGSRAALGHLREMLTNLISL